MGANGEEVVVRLDNGCEQPLQADAVAAHDHWHRAAISSQYKCAHALRVACAQLEDVPHLERGEALQLRTTVRTLFAGPHHAQVRHAGVLATQDIARN